jgi:hypothetical protein
MDYALSEEEESFSLALDAGLVWQDKTQPSAVAPGQLYSGPFRWETPPPSLQADNFFNRRIMNVSEQQRLFAIAMGSDMAPVSAATSRTSPWPDFNPEPSSITKSERSTSTSLSGSTSLIKPEQSTERNTEQSTLSGAPKALKERSRHNDIERRYRTSLQDRIAELREGIPSLRSRAEDNDDGDPPDSLSILKVSKVSHNYNWSEVQNASPKYCVA